MNTRRKIESHISLLNKLNNNPEQVIQLIAEKSNAFQKKYITVDMDVLDPAYAPAVGNPEADGISTNTLLNILAKICDSKVLALDLVEVDPAYDQGQTAIAAAKIIFEAIASIELSKKSK